MSFLETLAQRSVINRYQIDDIMEKAEEFGGDIDDALHALNIDSNLVRQAKSQYYNIPETVLTSENVNAKTLQYIPEDAARHYKALAYNTDASGVVLVGMVDPGNQQSQTALQFIFAQSHTPYVVSVISYDDFKRVMDSYTNFGPAVSRGVDIAKSESGGSGGDGELENLEEDLKETPSNVIVEDSPIAKTVGIMLRSAIDGGASDIHIEHTSDNVKVRFRVDGELATTYVLPRDARNTVVARIKILAHLKLDEKRKPQDGRFFAAIDGRKVDFRVSTFPTFFGEKVVIRILDPEHGVRDLDHTGMNQGHLDMIRRAAQRPYGIILLTGPTGSGKSTTLYSILSEVDREKRNVVSLEDPIEYNIAGVNQSQVHPEIDYTFANGLRSILRQDPDVIMVGEIRDKETAALAIQAALTGHLVLSTLHTNTALGAIPRLIDMGVDPYLIAPTLIMTIAQRLVKRIAPDAGERIPLDGGLKMMIDKDFADLPENIRATLPLQPYVYQAVSTPSAPGGTHGRIAVYEMLDIDKEIERAILENPNEQNLYALARARGMLTMKEDAILKCMQGLIPWSEINTL